MKNYKKAIGTLLTAAVLLIAVFMTGCTKLSEAPNNTSLEVDTPAEEDGFGVYIKLERSDASSVALQGGSFTKVCENADGSLLKAGEWLFTGDDITQLSKEENRSVLFTVSVRDADDTLLGEGTFLYDVTQEKQYVTISADGVTCATSDAPDAPADVPPVLTLPILDEIDTSVTAGTSGSSLLDYLKIVGGETDNLSFGAEGVPLGLEAEQDYLRAQCGSSDNAQYFAKENGFEQLNLEVRSSNARAIHLYEKYGFRKLCTFPHFFKINGEYIDFDLMNLELNPIGTAACGDMPVRED